MRVSISCHTRTGRDEKRSTNRAGLVLATLQDLDHAIIVIGGAELVLQSILAGTVEDALGAVADTEECQLTCPQIDTNHKSQEHKDSPVSHKDLPSIQHISQRNTAIPLPLLQRIQVINEDDKVLRAALVKDLVGAIVGARHLGYSSR